MSATASAPATPAVPGRDTLLNEPRPSLARLTKVELRKSYDTRAGFWLLATIAATTLLILVLSVLVFEEIDQRFENLVQIMQVPTGFLLPVVGILLVTSEWSQRSALTTFTLTPNRWRIVAAKALALTLLTLAAIAITYVCAAIGTGLTSPTEAWDGALSNVHNVLAVQLGASFVGFGFALLFLSSPLAIVLYFVLPTVWMILANTVPGFDDFAEWLDYNMTSGALLPAGEDGETVSGKDWAKYGTSLLMWLVLPLAAGLWRLRRAEVK